MRFAMFLVLLAASIVLSASASAAGHDVIFLHHSCGENLIEQGGVRERLSDAGLNFFDHGYNGDGLRLADGSSAGIDFDVPDDNTDPDGMARVFSQQVHSPPDNTLSWLLSYDVIVFKSCFPVSNIFSDGQLDEYKGHYLKIRDTIDRHEDRLFIIVTQPPQVPAQTSPEEAKRARELTEWLQSDLYLGGRKNLVVFDFFGSLADGDDVLKSKYREDEYDAHPNARANREIGPVFADFIVSSIRMSGIPPGSRTETRSTETLSSDVTVRDSNVIDDGADEAPVMQENVGAAASGVLYDFETDSSWGTSSETGSEVSCSVRRDESHGGSGSLHMDYDVLAHGFADCSRSFESIQDLSDGEGIEFWIRSSQAGHDMSVMVFAGSEMDALPFTSSFKTPGSRWSRISVEWSDFVVAEWASVDSAVLDPKSIIGFSFYLEGLAEGQEGDVWIDDIEVMSEDLRTDRSEVTTGSQRGVSRKDRSDGTGIILYIVLICVVLAAIGILVFVLVRKKKKR